MPIKAPIRVQDESGRVRCSRRLVNAYSGGILVETMPCSYGVDCEMFDGVLRRFGKEFPRHLLQLPSDREGTKSSGLIQHCADKF